MAKVRVKIDARKLKKSLRKVNPALNKAAAIFLPKEIIKSIERGVSPVKGKGRFKKYSQSYTTAIKKGFVDGKSRPRPVNLKQSGELLKSIKARPTAKSVDVSFTDEKADYHNKGTNKIPRRAMLPTEDGEEFNNSITLRLREVVTKVIDRILG